MNNHFAPHLSLAKMNICLSRLALGCKRLRGGQTLLPSACQMGCNSCTPQNGREASVLRPSFQGGTETGTAVHPASPAVCS